jgi:hypothetical protein
MIIGTGDIASILQNKWFSVTPFYTVFAAGVSNQFETKQSEFEREELLLLRQNYDNHLIYFSTLGIYNPGVLSPFAKHKLVMEEKIKKLWKKYTIIRIGDIDWGKNPNGLLNTIRHRLANNLAIEIKDECRYIVSKEELLLWLVNFRQGEKDTINVPGRSIKMIDVIEMVKAENPKYKGATKDLISVKKHIAEQEILTDIGAQISYADKMKIMAYNEIIDSCDIKNSQQIKAETIQKVHKILEL